MSQLELSHFPALSYAGAEAVNTLCTNLTFSGENVKKIMFTSCQAGEGKSFLSMNIMRTMAKLGMRVTLVDADLRRSNITSRFGLRFSGEGREVGLSHLLVGMADEDEVIYDTDLPGARLVPVGRSVSNSLPLLSSPRFPRLLEHLSQRSDYVLVDAPPVGALIDPAMIAKSCDGTVIVVSCNSIRRRELLNAREQIEQSGCPVLGVVLNKTDFDAYLNRKYYYKSYTANYDKVYSNITDDAPRKQRRAAK